MVRDVSCLLYGLRDPVFSFLEYFTKEDAEYAIHSLDGKLIGGNVVRVLDYHNVSPPIPSSRSRKLKL